MRSRKFIAKTGTPIVVTLIGGTSTVLAAREAAKGQNSNVQEILSRYNQELTQVRTELQQDRALLKENLSQVKEVLEQIRDNSVNSNLDVPKYKSPILEATKHANFNGSKTMLTEHTETINSGSDIVASSILESFSFFDQFTAINWLGFSVTCLVISVFMAMAIVFTALKVFRYNKAEKGEMLDDVADLLRTGMKGLILFYYYFILIVLGYLLLVGLYFTFI